MAGPIRAIRSLVGGQTSNFHENAPFLDKPSPEVDLELQENNRADGVYHIDADEESENGSHQLPEDYDGLDTDSKGTHRNLRSKLYRFLRLPRSFTRRIFASNREKPYEQQKARRIRPWTVFRRIVTAILMFLGIIQLAALFLGALVAFYPEKLDHSLKEWRSQEDLGDLNFWPSAFTAGVLPVACHSHNDYWRKVPLLSAIKAGCTGVEADVWLTNNDLYVGHDKSALRSDRTLNSLYINPLMKLLEHQNNITKFQPTLNTPRNGVFDTDSSQTLVFMIDIKTDFKEMKSILVRQLEPLRKKQYLTYFNGTDVIHGPITVVLTGGVPLDFIVANQDHRHMFFDAPLDRLEALAYSEKTLDYNRFAELDYLSLLDHLPKSQAEGQGKTGPLPTNIKIYQLANSYYASVDFVASIGYPRPYLSSTQRDKIKQQISGAHSRGLKVRYWNVPAWPVGLRNYLWRELIKMEVDFLNVDDLYSATKGDWRAGYNIWNWDVWGGRDW